MARERPAFSEEHENEELSKGSVDHSAGRTHWRKEKTTSPEIKDACDKYLLDATARGLKEPTLYKFRLLFRQLQDFSAQQGIVFISDFTSDNIRSFRATWPNKNFAARKKLENLRAFFRFCHVSEWIGKDPTIGLKPGRIADAEIRPITKEELKIERFRRTFEKHGIEIDFWF